MRFTFQSNIHRKHYRQTNSKSRKNVTHFQMLLCYSLFKILIQLIFGGAKLTREQQITTIWKSTEVIYSHTLCQEARNGTLVHPMSTFVHSVDLRSCNKSLQFVFDDFCQVFLTSKKWCYSIRCSQRWNVGSFHEVSEEPQSFHVMTSQILWDGRSRLFQKCTTSNWETDFVDSNPKQSPQARIQPGCSLVVRQHWYLYLFISNTVSKSTFLIPKPFFLHTVN